jgi:hypothetical protein
MIGIKPHGIDFKSLIDRATAAGRYRVQANSVDDTPKLEVIESQSMRKSAGRSPVSVAWRIAWVSAIAACTRWPGSTTPLTLDTAATTSIGVAFNARIAWLSDDYRQRWRRGTRGSACGIPHTNGDARDEDWISPPVSGIAIIGSLIHLQPFAVADSCFPKSHERSSRQPMAGRILPRCSVRLERTCNADRRSQR